MGSLGFFISHDCIFYLSRYVKIIRLPGKAHMRLTQLIRTHNQMWQSLSCVQLLDVASNFSIGLKVYCIIQVSPNVYDH